MIEEDELKPKKFYDNFVKITSEDSLSYGNLIRKLNDSISDLKDKENSDMNRIKDLQKNIVSYREDLEKFNKLLNKWEKVGVKGFWEHFHVNRKKTIIL